MTIESSNISRARSYLSAIENGVTGDVLAAFFTADVVQEEFPNRLLPNGMTRGLQQLLDGAMQGQRVLTSQRYDVLNTVASGEQVVMEVRWTGVMAVPVGTIPAGGEMRARFALFIEFREGKIARQRNYDCFDPW